MPDKPVGSQGDSSRRVQEGGALKSISSKLTGFLPLKLFFL